MIDIRGVKKSFGDIEVLKGVDLHIEREKIFGIAGRSGTGKSTLLRCINGLENYDEGNLFVDGIDVKSLSEKDLRLFRKDVGMIFQQFSLLSRLTVYENIALPLRIWKYHNSYIDSKVKELLEITGISDKINAKPCELSGGQKQRVAIARALSMNPKLLLCDEATSALDPRTAKSIIELLNSINKNLGITIIIVTHQMSVLRSTCENIAIIEDGKIEVDGTVEEIFSNQPLALKKLIGCRSIELPKTGVNLEIFFSTSNINKPIVTKMARELNIDYLILGGEMEKYKKMYLNSIIINVGYKDFNRVEKYLAKNKLKWKVLK